MNEVVGNEKFYLGYKIPEIPKEIFKDLLADKVIQSLVDNGQGKTDKEDVKYMCVRLYDKITTCYPSFRFLEVKITFDRGIEQEFGTFHRLTVKEFYSWFKKMDEELRHNMRRVFQREEKEEQEELAPVEYDNNAKRWRKLISFSLSHDIPEDVRIEMTPDRLDQGWYDKYPSISSDKLKLLDTKSKRYAT